MLVALLAKHSLIIKVNIILLAIANKEYLYIVYRYPY